MADTATESTRDVHPYFGLGYANYLVLPRTLLQSMPQQWQARFVAMLEELGTAFDHVPQAPAYKVEAAEEHEVSDLTEDQMGPLGITMVAKCPHGGGCPDYGDCVNAQTTWTDRDGREMDAWERVLIPVTDPVPAYDRGRTRIAPKLPEGTDGD